MKRFVFFLFFFFYSNLLYSQDNNASNSILKIPIKSVLLYNDRAQITREEKISIKSGETKFLIQDLPSSLEDESLRSNINSKYIHIASVNSYLMPMANFDDPEIKTLSFKIKETEKEQQKIYMEITRLDKKKSFLNLLSANTMKAISEKIFYTDSIKEVIDWRQSIVNVLKESKDTEEAIHSLGNELELVNASLKELLKKQDQLHSKLRKTKRVTEVTLNNSNTEIENGILEVSYIIQGTGWSPEYNISVTANNTVVVAYLAIIHQETGEDWQDVSLSLSTTIPEMIQYRPAVHSIKLKGLLAGKPNEQIVASQKESAKDDIKVESSTRKTSSFVIHNNLLYSYISSKKQHRLQINQFSQTSRIFLKSVPKKSKRVFEMSELANSLSIPMLPGKANIFRNDSYIGQIPIPYISPGNTFNLPSGLNNNLLVKYNYHRDKQSSGILSNNAVVTRTETMIIQNSGNQNRSILLENNLPVSDTEAVNVEIDKDKTTKGYKETVASTGILQWNIVVSPGKEEKVTLQYRVTLPEKSADEI